MIGKRLDTGFYRVTLSVPYDKGGVVDMLSSGVPRWNRWSSQTIQVVAVCGEKTVGQVREYVIDGWQPSKEFLGGLRRREPWQSIMSQPGTARQNSRRSDPASLAMSGGWSRRKKPGRRLPKMKAKHYDARHNCWCYLIREGGIVRYSDDGEPQGTAGQPMLEVFRRAGVENVCCVVTRYFGGILLGTGGLLRAYTRSAKDALDAAGIAQVRQWAQTVVECPYPLLERVKLEIAAAQGILGRFRMAPRSACPPCCLWSTGRPTRPDHGTDRRQDRGGEAGETFQAAPVEAR